MHTYKQAHKCRKSEKEEEEIELYGIDGMALSLSHTCLPMPIYGHSEWDKQIEKLYACIVYITHGVCVWSRVSLSSNTCCHCIYYTYAGAYGDSDFPMTSAYSKTIPCEITLSYKRHFQRKWSPCFSFRNEFYQQAPWPCSAICSLGCCFSCRFILFMFFFWWQCTLTSISKSDWRVWPSTKWFADDYY